MEFSLIQLGFIVTFAGMILMSIGIISEAFKEKETTTRGAGIIMIGPFPIIFGTDTESVKTVIVLTIVLILMVFILATRWYH